MLRTLRTERPRYEMAWIPNCREVNNVVSRDVLGEIAPECEHDKVELARRQVADDGCGLAVARTDYKREWCVLQLVQGRAELRGQQ